VRVDPFGIVVQKKVEHKALPTRTLYAHAHPQGKPSLDWRELLNNNRENFAKEEREAKLARVKVLWALPAQKFTMWNRWNRPIVRELIAVPARGVVEADLLARPQRATTSKRSGMYRKGVYSRGSAKRLPRNSSPPAASGCGGA
jgi:hypothetical protein